MDAIYRSELPDEIYLKDNSKPPYWKWGVIVLGFIIALLMAKIYFNI
jgi:hypothetical protein